MKYPLTKVQKKYPYDLYLKEIYGKNIEKIKNVHVVTCPKSLITTASHILDGVGDFFHDFQLGAISLDAPAPNKGRNGCGRWMFNNQDIVRRSGRSMRWHKIC